MSHPIVLSRVNYQINAYFTVVNELKNIIYTLSARHIIISFDFVNMQIINYIDMLRLV